MDGWKRCFPFEDVNCGGKNEDLRDEFRVLREECFGAPDTDHKTSSVCAEEGNSQVLSMWIKGGRTKRSKVV